MRILHSERLGRCKFIILKICKHSNSTLRDTKSQGSVPILYVTYKFLLPISDYRWILEYSIYNNIPKVPISSKIGSREGINKTR